MGFEISPHRKKKGNAFAKTMAGGLLVSSLVIQGYTISSNPGQETEQQSPAIYPSELPGKVIILNPPSVSRGDASRNEEKYKAEKVITAISNNLGGVFLFKSEYIYNTSKKYNVNPMLVAAIMRHETGNGTSQAVKMLNNPGGLMGNNGLMRFNSLEAGIEKMIIVLKEYYIDQGLTTIEQIQKKYCPVGASNDPTNLNVHWLPNVTKTYLKILEEAK